MTEAADYDFGTIENSLKCFKGVLVESLRTVLCQVNSTLTAQEDALCYVESLCLRLLGMLCAKPPPHTIQDIEDRVTKTFPTPLEQWALKDARETIDKSKKKKLVLPLNQIQNLLHKEVLQYKLDNMVALFLVAVLEYISADIFVFADRYVRNLKKEVVTEQDIKIAMLADKVLMELFQGENNISPSPFPTTPRSSQTYEDVVRELIHDVKQHQRDLHMIIWVFREELAKCVHDPRELDVIFPHIYDIYDVTVALLGTLEDVIEMSQEQQSPLVGSCFEELAEAAEFEIYEKYAEDIMSSETRDALQELVNRPDASKLSSASRGFREAVKYYLPKLLLGPIWHAFSYFEYVRLLLDLSPNAEDKEVFRQVQFLLDPLQTNLKQLVSSLPKDTSYAQLNNRDRRHRSIEKTRKLQNTVEHFGDKETAGQRYNEFIREDTLEKLSSGRRTTERKVYLFDGQLILCKPIRAPNSAFDFRQKERFTMSRFEVVDRSDTDDFKYLFELSLQQNQSLVFIARSAQQKNDWMADLIMVNMKSTLDRILDSILLNIEKKHPLKLPSPDIYKFATPDSPDNIVLEVKANPGTPDLIKGATLCKLIERLTYHIVADPTFVRVFLTTYRSFCTPMELLQLLIERYNIPEPNLVYEQTNNDLETDKLHKSSQREDWKRYRKEFVQPVQIRVLNVLRHWVDHHFYDFERDPALLQELESFLDTVNGKSMRKWVETLKKIIHRKREQEESHKQITFAFGFSPPPIEYHLRVPETEISLLTLHPLELARQLTIFEFEMFKTVKSAELAEQLWTKADKETSSPNLLRIIKHTTKFSYWLVKSIVSARNFEERVAMLNRAIEVMMVLSELNNFNGVISVVSALESAPVFRLKHTHKAINERYRMFAGECRELLSQNYKNYQEKLRSINPPCVPFVGMYLTNIVHIEEGNKDELPNTELINFSKRRKIADILGEIQQYQNQPYCLQVEPTIRNFLEHVNPFSENPGEIDKELYDQSLIAEPKETDQIVKHPRNWPDLPLKSPGTKPKRHSTKSISMAGTLPFSKKAPISANISSNSSSVKASSYNNSEGEQSPTGTIATISSAHDFSVFANVHIHSSVASLSASQANLNANANANDTMSSNCIMLPPELPKRSNSITSLSSNGKPTTLSPRMANIPNNASRSQPIISPKSLGCVNEERSPPHSAFVDSEHLNFNRATSQNTSNHKIQPCLRNSSVFDDIHANLTGIYPTSPKLSNVVEVQDFGPLPISPHVNVPHPDNSFRAPPPPLPPRRRERHLNDRDQRSAAQSQQAPDAPELPPRDISPPPVPPRICPKPFPENIRREHNLMLPNTSTIMMRRNSALRESSSSTGDTNASTATTPSSATAAPAEPTQLPSDQQESQVKNDSNIAPPISRKISSGSSPCFSPGETTPKLPPKPKTTNFAAYNDRSTHFPYPSTNHE